MKVLVTWKDERIYQAVVEVADLVEVTEELVNCLDTSEFVEPTEEISGKIEILNRVTDDIS